MPVVLMPVGGCTPDRNDPPTRGQRSRRQKTVKRSISLRRSEVELCHAGRPYAGRGLHPRPERSTHAGAEEQKTENSHKIHFLAPVGG